MDNNELTDNYFNETLSPEALQQFDRKIQEDPAFAGDVAFYAVATQQVKSMVAEAKKKRFREIYEVQGADKKTRPPLVYMNKWWQASLAAAVLIAFIATWLWWPQPDPGLLADNFIKENFSEMRVTMGTTNKMQTAADLYNRGKLPEALAIFEESAAADHLNTNAIKNAGIVSLQLKEYDKAINYFDQLENRQGLAVNPGRLYHAVTLLKRNLPGDRAEADKLLRSIINSNADEAITARKLLKHR